MPKILSSGKSARYGSSSKTKKRTGTVKKRATPSSGKSKTRKGTLGIRRSSAPTDKLAANALKLIDQAAKLLRKGVISGASQSFLVQHAARKKAHALIENAYSSLGEALETGTSALHKMLGKI
ncbi:MAG: hypothetical protein C5B47_07495 [Verrucomicrobia bacterium]|nr:MAG: hypothetical protein C5B47_07495 [Verrucomicrobiota bacterium]